MMLKPGERLDDLQLQDLKIIQDPSRFCFGVDAVLLSNFVKIKKNERILDLGTGTGIIPILLAAKTQGSSFVGLEIQKDSADMAKRSVLYNCLQDRISIVEGDIKEAAQIFCTASFDVIVSNPPYMIHGHGALSGGDALAIARHEIHCSLDDVLRESMKMLQDSKGRFYMIHKPKRLGEIITKMNHFKIEPKRLQFVHPYVDKEPTMVLIEGLRGGKQGLRVEPPIIMYSNS